MERHVPGMKQEARELVERTNTVRKVKSGPDFVDLKQFGASRAKESHVERIMESSRDLKNSSMVNDQEKEFQL